ncbi:MAG: hypothetical protein J0I41_13265 [Filimonas sp.]|nr:hypothetical protein [Filimonas sp.]
MKHTLIVLFVLLISSTFVQAQSNKEDVDMIQAMFGKDKKELMSAYMAIPAKDSVKFWKLYDEYEAKRKAISRERIQLLQKYADEYSTLTDAQASQLAIATVNNDNKTNNLYLGYYKKFSEVIGGKSAAKMFQLETYLQTVIRLGILNNIPFIGELDGQRPVGTKS